LRCSFEQCRLTAWRSVPSLGVRASFRQCYRSDFQPSNVGAGGTALREFTELAGAPTQRVQSVRTVFQDTPWAQTGPRQSFLRASDFALQAAESSTADSLVDIQGASSYPWKLSGGATGGKFVFGALQGGQTLHNDVAAFDLSGTGTKIVTYQALVRAKGKGRFALVNSADTSKVYDEVLLDSQGGFSDLTLVTLRAQVVGSGDTGTVRLLVANALTGTGTGNYLRLQMTSQQAWGGKGGDTVWPLEGGLANATLASTPDDAAVQSKYPWSMNALNVRAAGRLAIPAKASRFGWGQRALIGTDSADLRDGDVYYDTTMMAVLMVMDEDQMFLVHQAERVQERTASATWEPGGAVNHKNIVFVNAPGGTARTVTLETDTAKVPDGTVVRVYRASNAAYGVNVRFGSGGADNALAAGRMGEYVFSGGKWRSVVHDAAFVARARPPCRARARRGSLSSSTRAGPCSSGSIAAGTRNRPRPTSRRRGCRKSCPGRTRSRLL